MAQKTRLITTSGTAALLWQTSTGVAPDTAVAPTSGIYRAGTVNDPVPIIIPCHRVIAADGSLGGYACGLRFKRKLLDLEAGTVR